MAKKKFYKDQQESLLNFLSNDPRQFWRKICDIGIHSNRKNIKSMPDSVRTKSGGIISGKKQILGTWKTYFRDLLNPSENPSDVPPPSLGEQFLQFFQV